MNKFAVLVILFLAATEGVAQETERPKLDVAFSTSTLGFGIQAAKPLPRRSDLRGGFNFLRYGTELSKDGADYAETVTLQSIHLQYDKYLYKGCLLYTSPSPRDS